METNVFFPIQEIKQASPLRDILSLLGFPHPDNYTRRYRTVCLLHGGKNRTSFSVNLDKGTFRCFSCGKHGDQVTLVQESLGLDFFGAVQWLAERAGIQFKRRKRLSERDKKHLELKNIFLGQINGLDEFLTKTEDKLYDIIRTRMPKKLESARDYSKLYYNEYLWEEIDKMRDDRISKIRNMKNEIYGRR